MHVASAAAAPSSAACLHNHNESEQNQHVQVKANLLQMERLDFQVQNAFILWKQLLCLHAIPSKIKSSVALHRCSQEQDPHDSMQLSACVAHGNIDVIRG